MHLCSEEIVPIVAAIPFIGVYFKRIYFWFANLFGFKKCSHSHQHVLEQAPAKQSSKPPLYVISLFDKEGYYTSVKAATEEEVKAVAAKRSSVIPGLAVCSIPFLGTWISNPLGVGDDMFDVSMPADYKEVLEPSVEH